MRNFDLQSVISTHRNKSKVYLFPQSNVWMAIVNDSACTLYIGILENLYRHLKPLFQSLVLNFTAPTIKTYNSVEQLFGLLFNLFPFTLLNVDSFTFQVYCRLKYLHMKTVVSEFIQQF